MEEYGKTDEAHDITITVYDHDMDPDMKMPMSSEYRGMSNRDCDLRLVIVFQKDSNIPIYFRYVPEKLLHVPCLTAVNRRFESLGIGANFAMMDSSCCNKDNVLKMLENDIPFTMMIPEDNEYYQPIKERMDGSGDGEVTRYERNGFVFSVYSEDVTFENGCTCHVHAVDIPDDVRNDMEPDVRIIVTSNEMDAGEAVSICYVRHLADELRTSTESYVDRNNEIVRGSPTIIRGHMIVSFIAASLIQMLRNDLESLGIDAMDAYALMKNQKCKVFKSRVIPARLNDELRDLYDRLGMSCPAVIPRQGGD